MRLTQPVTDDDELNEIRDVLKSGYLTQGPKASEFEKQVAIYTGTEYAIATSSCTTALHLALVAIGLEANDEVLIPDFTFPATANVVLQQGAKPRVVDINLETFNIDLSQVEAAITPNTRAIMPVHAFGLCADMAQINEIAARHNLSVIEDAACALGSTIQGSSPGTQSDAACFSFHPRKVITTGEGGLIATNSEELYQRARILSTHGGRAGDLFMEFEQAGFNYRLSDINAAVGVAQMRKLDQILLDRKKIAGWYSDALSGMPFLSLPKEPDGYGHSYQSYVVLLEKDLNRDQIIRKMRASGIEVTLGTYSLAAQHVYQEKLGLDSVKLPNSAQAFKQSLTLPLHVGMHESDVHEVVETLVAVIAKQQIE